MVEEELTDRLEKEAAEKEAKIKKWATNTIRQNYEDYERLLNAKLNEVKAQLASSGGDGSAGLAVAGTFNSKKYDDWIGFHEPKINLIQKSLKEMNEELQEKVSFAMVQSMIRQAGEDGILKSS